LGACPALEDLDLSGCPSLEYVLLQSHSLTTVNLSNCGALSKVGRCGQPDLYSEIAATFMTRCLSATIQVNRQRFLCECFSRDALCCKMHPKGVGQGMGSQWLPK
jgi:hypothetical protein